MILFRETEKRSSILKKEYLYVTYINNAYKSIKTQIEI
jgi:hypothetical protein